MHPFVHPSAHHYASLRCLVLSIGSGNLATKSLTPIVDPKLLVQDSEYLESHLIVVPTGSKKEFLKEYETLAPMVVPRSAIPVAEDDEFALFVVTTFKKHSAEFLQKCREQKWTPRQYKYVEGGKEEEQRELDRVAREERKVWGEALWLARTSWSESVMIWMHALTLRAFVETVLRYGLPLEFVSVLVKVSYLLLCSGAICTPAASDVCVSTDTLPNSHPPRPSRRSRRHSTPPTPTSAATRSVATRRARSPRTMPH